MTAQETEVVVVAPTLLLLPLPLLLFDTQWPSVPTLLVPLSTHFRTVASARERNRNREMGTGLQADAPGSSSLSRQTPLLASLLQSQSSPGGSG